VIGTAGVVDRHHHDEFRAPAHGAAQPQISAERLHPVLNALETTFAAENSAALALVTNDGRNVAAD
jgi:hypothetical protein